MKFFFPEVYAYTFLIGNTMKHLKKASLLILLLCLFSLQGLSALADLTVAYEEELDTTISSSLYFGIQSLQYPVACHVGTLTLSYTSAFANNQLSGLYLERSGNWGNGVEYWLQSSRSINWQTRFGAQLIAKVRYGYHTDLKVINWSDSTFPLLNSTALKKNMFPIVIDFYLGIRNIFYGSQAIGAAFQFEDESGPNLGDFKLLTQKNWSLQPINDTPASFFAINYNEGSSNYLNGQADPQVQATLSIEQDASEESFPLASAVNNGRAQVGQARITVSGAQSLPSYGVTISFTDGNGGTGYIFNLKHEHTDDLIPFSLYLGTTHVQNMTPIPWESLQLGSDNLRSLYVGNIMYQDIENKIAGQYYDTITATITPLDTN